jgi:hypothetical protein
MRAFPEINYRPRGLRRADSVVGLRSRIESQNPCAGNSGHKLPLLFTQTITMGTYYTKDEHGKINGIMTVASIYKFGGFTFEFSNFLGPLKLNKDLMPSAATGRKFFKAFDEWAKLSDEEKLETLIFG